jgi:hypothetical protein
MKKKSKPRKIAAEIIVGLEDILAFEKGQRKLKQTFAATITNGDNVFIDLGFSKKLSEKLIKQLNDFSNSPDYKKMKFSQWLKLQKK